MVDLAVVPPIGGLPFGIDVKQITKPTVVDGRNFLVDINGPYSAFGGDLLTSDRFAQAVTVQSFRVGERMLYLTEDGIYEYSVAARALVLRVGFAPALPLNACWTRAQVGPVHFFARKGAGLWCYNPALNWFYQVIGEFIPVDLISCAGLAGRLLLLSESFLHWSAFDDGVDFAPDVGTGAGFQSLSLVGSNPKGMIATDFAVFTFLSNGVMETTAINSPLVFRHSRARWSQTPLSPWCLTEVGKGKALFLSAEGLYEITQEGTKEFAPLFGEFLSRKFLPRFADSVNLPVRLAYLESMRTLFLSVNTVGFGHKYAYAWANYLPRNEWGRFDRQHTSLIEWQATPSTLNAFRGAWTDFSGDIRLFTDLPRVQNRPSNAIVLVRPPVSEVFSLGIDENDLPILAAAHSATFYTPDEEVFPDSGTGFYRQVLVADDSPTVDLVGGAVEVSIGEDFGEDWLWLPDDDEDWLLGEGSEDWMLGDDLVVTGSFGLLDSGAILYKFEIARPEEAALNSWTKIGPIRFVDGEHTDRLSILDKVQIAGGIRQEFVESEDWMDGEDDFFEDWSIADDSYEDWGFGLVTRLDYSIRFLGTIDGKNTWNEQDIAPHLAFGDEDMTLWVSSVVGLYNFVVLEATEVRSAYNLSKFEVSGMQSGTL